MAWFTFVRLARPISWTIALLVALVAAQAAIAQSTPTAEQLQIFQGLSPEQQQAVLQQAAGARAEPAGDTRAERRAEESAATRRNPTATGGDRAASDALAPNDLVLVELAFPGTMTRGSVRSANMQDPSVDVAPRRVRVPPANPPTPEQQRRWSGVIEQVSARNPYQLDRDGYLNLPGFAPILLAGLSEQQAVQLLSTVRALLDLDVSLSRSPVARTGVERLKPFGYDLFEDVHSSVSPVAGSPVPADYVIGPGDELVVQLFGSQNRTLRLVVTREGTVSFPELGPIQVSGQRFSGAKSTIESRVSQQMIGVRANVSMGDMRLIRVFVSGDVERPGSYTVSGLDTMLSALYASGGVKPIGSLRDIQLKRQGVTVRRLDLYDLRIRGDKANDALLQPDDVIFIPPVGPTVSIDGEVKRPAIYELRGETTVESLLQMAGGFSNDADPRRTGMTRRDEQYRQVVLDVDFTTGGGSLLLKGGDAVRVARLRPQLDSGVTLDGFVHRPGPVAWRAGLRLTDVIASIDELKPNADPGYVFVRRESAVDRIVEVVTADLLAALRQPGGRADIELKPRDKITVFDLSAGRERIIKPVIDELHLQSGLARPVEVVRVEGRVKAPGEYPLESGMTVSDLLRAGGGLDTAAFGGKAEIARNEVGSDGARQTRIIEVDLESLRRGDVNADLALRSSDFLLIKETPDWTERESVTLSGEVRFPGTYPIGRGETLYEVLQRAGGFTSRAFTKGSAFTRVELREREQKELDVYIEGVEGDVAIMAMQAAAANQTGASQSLAAGQSMLARLKQSRAIGRLVIDLPGLVQGGKGSPKDVILRNGDLLFVPPQKQEVTVIGEVQTTTSHLFDSELRRDDYISKSGGTTRKADLGKIYVVRADGSKIAPKGGRFRRGYDVAIQPGDTIVVPLDTERMPKLPFWQAVTSIIYNLAVSVAAINSF
jgi:polysaccharide export outer membrane protein